MKFTMRISREEYKPAFVDLLKANKFGVGIYYSDEEVSLEVSRSLENCFEGMRNAETHEAEVYADGELLDLAKDAHYHSDAFEWGFNGSGPAQLSLAMLVHVVSEHFHVSRHIAYLTVEDVYHAFKERVIAQIKEDYWVLSYDQVLAHLDELFTERLSTSKHITLRIREVMGEENAGRISELEEQVSELEEEVDGLQDKVAEYESRMGDINTILDEVYEHQSEGRQLMMDAHSLIEKGQRRFERIYDLLNDIERDVL